MIVVPGYQCNQVVAPFGMADEKKSSADKKQENNDHAFPKKVHSAPNQCYSALSFLHTQRSDPVVVQFDGVARASRPWITRKMRVPHSNCITTVRPCRRTDEKRPAEITGRPSSKSGRSRG